MKIAIVGKYQIHGSGPSGIIGQLKNGFAKINGIKVDVLSTETMKYKNRFLKLIEIYYKLLIGKYNVINIHSSNTLPLLLVPYNLFFGSKIFFTIHGIPKVEKVRENVLEQLYIEFVNRIMPIFYKKIIVVSDLLKKVIISNYKIDPQRITVIYNGVEDRFFNVNSKSHTESEVKLLYLGGLRECKGIKFLLSALLFIPDTPWKLILAGPRFDDMVKFFSEFLEKNSNFKHRLEYLDLIDREKLLMLMQEIDIVIAPSRFDTFNVVILEAMAAGKPVIASDGNGASEIITDGLDGLIVKYGDTKDLAYKIRLLIMDKDLRSIIGQSARNKAREFTTEKLARNYLECFSKKLDMKQ